MNNFLLASILYNYNLLYLEQPKKALNAQYDHNITCYLFRVETEFNLVEVLLVGYFSGCCFFFSFLFSSVMFLLGEEAVEGETSVA